MAITAGIAASSSPTLAIVARAAASSVSFFALRAPRISPKARRVAGPRTWNRSGWVRRRFGATRARSIRASISWRLTTRWVNSLIERRLVIACLISMRRWLVWGWVRWDYGPRRCTGVASGAPRPLPAGAIGPRVVSSCHFKPPTEDPMRLTPVLALCLVAACAPIEEAPVAPQEVTFRASDFAFSGPDTIAPGMTRLTMSNDGPALHPLILARIDDGHTLDELYQFVAANPDTEPEWVTYYGAANAVATGDNTGSTVYLPEGQYVVLC